ncbi:MAG: Na+/H+ antiporter [Caldilineales bacterium]|nr:Na+/H+ antiporter [Caldilineales bacterium]
MEGLLSAEITIVEILLLVSVVAMIAQRIRIPYTVALVLVGLILSVQNVIPLPVELTDEIILLLILPPLVFEAALHIDLDTFRDVITPVLLLAIFGVLIAVLIVAGILGGAGLLSWQTALLFGALIAATDPVAVISLFKALGAPKRLATLVESESLFNDATTIVVFHIILAAVVLGNAHFSLTNGILEFLKVALGGAAIGIGIGIIANWVFSMIDDHLIETTLSTVVAYGSYLIAEQFHLSGVLAVVFAGMLIGNRSSNSMSPTTRLSLMNFWEYIAFLVNSLIFILIGLEVSLPSLSQAIIPIIVALVVVLLSRAVSVYSLSFVSGRIGNPVPAPYQHVLFWGGLRGAVGLALALSIPRSYADRDLIITLTFVVVLFTLLVQATTVGGLLKRLGLVGRPEAELEYERIQGRMLAVSAALRRLEVQYDRGLLNSHAWEVVSSDLSSDLRELRSQMSEFIAANPDIAARIVHSTEREALRTQRAAVVDLMREGVLSEEVAQALFEEIDHALENPLAPEADMPGPSNPSPVASS